MTIVATITTASGDVISLDKFLTPDGRVPGFQRMEEEALKAPGVDGVRYRDVGLQYPIFTVDALETATNYTAAVTQCRIYDAMNSKNVRLVISNLGGTSVYTYERVHIRRAIARPVPGVVAGSAAGVSHTAHIVTDFEMQIMQVVAGANP